MYAGSLSKQSVVFKRNLLFKFKKNYFLCFDFYSVVLSLPHSNANWPKLYMHPFILEPPSPPLSHASRPPQSSRLDSK